MRPVPDRLSIIAVAQALGAVPYRKGGGDIKGVSFTFEQLDQFAAKMINPHVITRDMSDMNPKGWAEAVEAVLASDKRTISMEAIRPRGARISPRGKKS